jgi:SAM-dependent methyltransferase
MELLDYYIESSNRSDKGKEHNYIQWWYDKEFSPKREEEINLLEIGIFNGQSIKLWREFFPNAKITAIDVELKEEAQFVKDLDINLIIGDAYDTTITDKIKESYDYIIDDGPHTIDSQLEFVKLYNSKLKEGGKLIIEDIDNWRKDNSHFITLANLYKMKLEGGPIQHHPHKHDNCLLIYTK